MGVKCKNHVQYCEKGFWSIRQLPIPLLIHNHLSTFPITFSQNYEFMEYLWLSKH